MTSLWIAAVLAMTAPQDALVWLGASRGESVQTLHTAGRRYVKPGAPAIWLVGVSHLGDETYYRDVADLLEDSDVVIYEGVLSEGARAPGGLDDAQRAASTEAALKVLADAATELPEPPGSMASMAEAMVERHRVLANVVRTLQHDGWGRPVRIVHTPDGVVFRSLGSDGRPGGDGAAADIEAAVPVGDVEGASLQQELARALRLRFQLSELPYERPNWEIGDLSAEEVSRRLSAGGETFELGGLLTGTSLSGRLAVGMIRMLPTIDALSGGRAIDGMRLLMIEMLSNRDLVEKGVALYGERLEQVILHDRNDAAVEAAIERTRSMAPDTTIAVLYGAAHMPGIDAQLKDVGWEPVETRWLGAISVDLNESNLTADDVDAMRQWSKMAGSMFGGQ